MHAHKQHILLIMWTYVPNDIKHAWIQKVLSEGVLSSDDNVFLRGERIYIPLKAGHHDMDWSLLFNNEYFSEKENAKSLIRLLLYEQIDPRLFVCTFLLPI